MESTIRFSAQLEMPDRTEGAGTVARLVFPREASLRLPSHDQTMAEGTLNGFPFRAALVSNNVHGEQHLEISSALRKAAAAKLGATATVEITRIEEENEIRVPMEFQNALNRNSAARALWASLTPMGRRDWILWITSAKQSETRTSRIEKVCSMLLSGKRRVCCFGGLKWLTKDHPEVGETWLPLQKSK